MSQPIRRYVVVAAIAVPVFVLGYRQGSYGGRQLAEAAAIACLAGSALLIGGARLARPWPFVVFGGLLAALTAWTALSLTWATSADAVLPSILLLSVYLGVFVFVVFSVRRRTLSMWCDGLAVGVAAVGLVALLSRFFPHLFEAARLNVDLLPGSSSRLAFPVGYWNGLGILLACGVPLYLRSAVGKGSAARKVLSVGFLPAVGTVVYLASSRGAALTAATAAVLYVVLSGSRWVAAGSAALLGVAGSAASIGVVTREPDLVDRPLSSAASHAGPWALAGVAVVCVLTGAAFAIADRRVLGAWRPPRRLAVTVAVAAVVLAAAALVTVDLPARFTAFKASPLAADSTGATIRSHFVSSGSTGRWQLWGSAVREFEHTPVYGGGAGSFESWWAKHGTLPVFVRNAHSLYLETLAELGIVGFLLLAAFVLGGIGLGLSALVRTAPDVRYQPAAPLAVFTAFAVAAAFDWIWQLPVIGVVAIVCLGILVGAAAGEPDAPAPPAPSSAGRVVAVAAVCLMVPLFLLATLDAAAQIRLGRSQSAAAAGDGAAAVSEAQAARALEPWSAAPLLRLALAEERFGSLPLARAAIDEAVRRDSSDWRLRLIAARLQAKVGDLSAASRSLDAARALNPRSPLFARPG